MSSRPPFAKVLIVILYALALFSGEALGTTAVTREKDLKKAEKIIGKLRRLEQTAAAANHQTYRKSIDKYYPGLFIDISGLRDGDLKTDLATAAFLYEEADHEWFISGRSAVNCETQVRELYRRLCLTSRSDTRTQFLWAKARLHVGWAAAMLRFHRGDRDAETMSDISLIRSERETDLTLAEEAVTTLKRLAEQVVPSPSPAELERKERVAQVSFDGFSNKYRQVAAIVDVLLSSLPRSAVYYQLQNARNSYLNGLFWWQKSYGHQSATVSVNALATPEPLKVMRMEAEVVNYTVVANWRSGQKYIRQTEVEIEKARRGN